MSPSARQNKICELLTTHGECSVAFLARRLGVSEMSVRRDLQALVKTQRVVRTHGGASSGQRVAFDFHFLQRSREHQKAKEALARAASELVPDGSSVLLDSGTTTLALAAQLKSKHGLTVITTSLPIASELQFCTNIEILLLGGTLRPGSPDLMGPMTESNLEQLRADIAFLGADGVDLSGNVYTRFASLPVGRMLSKMAAAARRVFIIADSSKIGRTALMKFGHLSQWEGLITDSSLTAEMSAALARARVHVIRAPLRGKERSRDSRA